LLLKATAILALATGAGWLLQKSHPRARILLWRAALVLALAVPLVNLWGPRFEVEVTRPAPAETAKAAEAPAASTPQILPAVNSPSFVPSVSRATVSPPKTPRDWSGIFGGLVLVIWMIGAMVAGLRFRISLRQADRLIANSRPVNEALAEEGAEIARELGWSKPPAIRLSDEITCPLVAGVMRPTLLLPAGQAYQPGELSGILAHEITHLRGRDVQWQGAFGFLCVLLWFHPLAWLAAAAHIAACEEACDAAAADYVGSSETYRRTLARVALAVKGRQPAGALPMARSAQIFRRLEALKRRPADFILSRQGKVILVAAGLAVLFGCGGARVTRSKAPPAVNQGNTASKEKQANSVYPWGAKGTQGSSFTVGNNKITLDSVIRWGSDGEPKIENGRGGTFLEYWGNLPDYKQAAAWLDLADIRISGAEPFEIPKVEIYYQENDTWHSLSQGTGYDFDGSTVHIRSLGKPLPDRIALWLWVVNFPKKGLAWRLPGKEGERVEMNGPGVELQEIRSGEWTYAAVQGTNQSAKNENYEYEKERQNDKNKLTAVFHWYAPDYGLGGMYQVCAVDKNGKRHLSGVTGHISPSSPVVVFELPKEQLDYFEFRPFENIIPSNHFYFEDVKLPKIDGRGFASPPKAVIPVKGKETVFATEAFAPFRMTGQVRAGAQGERNSENGQIIPGVRNPKSEATISYSIPGIMAPQVFMKPRDRRGREFIPDMRYGTRNHDHSLAEGAEIWRTPLNKIDSIEFELK
jgi:beta-lactamase regulating signal transducer with metallopeptidase domain